MAFKRFDTNSAPPSTFPPRPQFGNFPSSPLPSPQITPINNNNSPAQQRSPIDGFNKNPGSSFPSRIQQNQFGCSPHSPSPPPHVSPFNNNSNSTSQQRSPRLESGQGLLYHSGISEASQRGQSHILGRNPPNTVLSYPFELAQRPTVTPPRWGSHPILPSGESKFQIHQQPANFQGSRITRSPPPANNVYSDDFTQDIPGRGLGAPQRMQSPPRASNSNPCIEHLRHPFEETRRWPSEPSNIQASKKTWTPPQHANEFIWRNSPLSQGAERAVVSPPKFGHTSTLSGINSDSTIRQSSFPFSPHNEVEGAGSKSINSHVSKRNRSPSLASGDEYIPGTSYSTQDDTERELQAKAKRLARFGVELSQPAKNLDNTKQKFSANRYDQAMMEKRKLVADQSIEAAGDSMLSDYEGLDSSSVIIGLCPDMCPESEREERERKGDLDKYERLDGDRNQTSISLAVKKYNRTAEREADLIRPMPILQQTIDYLLALLDQPYDDRFLGMYNFLWDRMRAIRMDLRMQHLFNQNAITMLEQMIRLHIIAIHELCEYTKGEGFSEGFDAHLNIEQMNKTSVELFQMYDDHRKRGSTVVSEKEFRGYYALLKLDKHPGYKVEPAELSVDLAKMTPEIRQTPEILFARDVARACRTGNFIAFFRLARKATYLQACLMHAHFAKLRTQALASLHCGLQINQGIPISHVTKWLGMEEEDIESLLEYHGFVIKEFEELYMVKEGPFLNSDKDYPTKCSRLVHLKKSRRIFEDVSSSNQLMWPTKEPKRIVSAKKVKPDSKAIQFAKSRPSFDVIDEVMLTLEEDPALIGSSQIQPMLEIPFNGQSDCQVAEVFNVSSQQSTQSITSDSQVAEVFTFSSSQQSPHSAVAKVDKVGKYTQTLRNNSLERTLQGVPINSVTERAQTSEASKGSSESWEGNSARQIVFRPQEDDETSTIDQELEDEGAVIEYHDLEEEKEEEEDMMMVNQDTEVVMAKLKLILRKWKRLSSKRKDLREQRQLAANAALSSLTLGPPIQQIKALSSQVCELNIGRVSKERRERHQKSWSRMNISEVVGEILSKRNPDAKCLCWKMIVCSQPIITEGDISVQRSQNNHLASLWLHYKLKGIRTDNDDELVISSQELSIWKKWVTHQYDSSPICCLSIIREVEFNMMEYVCSASGILFLVSESVPLDVQRSQLYNLSMCLPSGACVPLLILCGTKKDGTTTIINRLGLHDLDKTRISSFLVGTLMAEKSPKHLNGLFSTERLREGLQWLANQSPIQPVVRRIKTRDLVMDHLNSSLGKLNSMNALVVGPNHCVSAFNEALDRSTTEVTTVAETNPSGWPCHEITLLESSNEHSVVESYLPSVGWNSAATIEPILSRIEGCKLPFFPEDLSWLNNGSDIGDEILHHKSELENCLVRYLTNSSEMMDKALATAEARVILQKGALLELQGSKYFIRPKWVAIFRRIINWRLMNLSTGVESSVYVLDHRSNTVTFSEFGVEELSMGASSSLHGSDNTGLEVYGSLPYSLNQLSLDEMMGVFYNTSPIGREQSKPEALQLSSRIANQGKEALCAATASDNMEDETTKTGDAYLFDNPPGSLISDNYLSRAVLANKGTKEADKLSQLLEQCNLVQNKIDEKLSLYF